MNERRNLEGIARNRGAGFSRAAAVLGMLASVLVFCFPAAAQEPPKPPLLVTIDGQGISDFVHDFTGLPLTPTGWTDLESLVQSPGYTDARVVFVSASTGNDSNGRTYTVGDVRFDENGMFQPRSDVSPFKTIAAAYSQTRSGYPDIVLLKRGDEWNEGFTPTSAGRVKSGRSIDQRHIIASYGTGDRPRLYAASINGRDASYTIVTGLHLYENDWRTAGRALEVTGDVTHQLYEDMRFHQKSEDKIQGGTSGISNVAIRRSFYSNYQAHDGFVYVARVDGLLFEENVYFEPWQKGYPDETRHGRHLYLSPSGSGDDKNALKNVILRGNIFFRAERGGIDARGGGRIENNLILQNDSLSVGGSGGSSDSIQSVEIVHNVFMQGPPNIGGENRINLRNIDGGLVAGNLWTDPRGLGRTNTILLSGSDAINILKNVEISENVIYAFQNHPNGARAIDLSSAFEEVENVVVRNNVFQYPEGSDEIIRHRDWIGSQGDRFSGFVYRENQYFSPNASTSFVPGSDFSGWVQHSGDKNSIFMKTIVPDSGRTIDKYMTSINHSGGIEKFVQFALGQSRTDWDSRFSAPEANDYMRAGFGIPVRK